MHARGRMRVSMSAGVPTIGSAQMRGGCARRVGRDDGDLRKGLFCNLALNLLPQWVWICMCVYGGSNDDPRNRT